MHKRRVSTAGKFGEQTAEEAERLVILAKALAAAGLFGRMYTEGLLGPYPWLHFTDGRSACVIFLVGEQFMLTNGSGDPLLSVSADPAEVDDSAAAIGDYLTHSQGPVNPYGSLRGTTSPNPSAGGGGGVA